MSKSEHEFTHKLLTDAAFREELKRDPRTVMREHGIDVPDDVEIEVLESTPKKRYVSLPKLHTSELTDEQLAAAVQGGTASSIRCTDAFQDTVCI